MCQAGHHSRIERWARVTRNACVVSFLCDICSNEGFEPKRARTQRHHIILAARIVVSTARSDGNLFETLRIS